LPLACLGSLDSGSSAAGSTSGWAAPGLGLLGGLGEGLQRAFEVADGAVDLVHVVAGDRVLDGLDLAFEHRLEFGRGLVAEFGELFLDAEDEVFRLVLGIDLFDALAVFLGVGLGVALGFFDLVLGEAGGSLDGDFLFLAGLFVLGGDVEDAVGVDVEGDFDLRFAAAGGAMPSSLKFPNNLLSENIGRSPWQMRMSTAGWLSEAVEKTCDFLAGMVVLRSIIGVAREPSVSIESVSGVTSSSSTSLTSPRSTPPWMEAPMATTSSGFTPW
jgi:hypothetical protein